MDREREVEATDGHGDAQALYFDSSGVGLFAWLHRQPAGTAASLGLVICKPFGYEALCAHRGIRDIARTVARSGVPVLRFDYAGTGDSADIDARADQIEAWVGDVVAAVALLKRLTGVTAVAVLGFRLGSLLAVLAAERCQVFALGLVAPIVSGPRFLKELRARMRSAALGAERSPASASAAVSAGASGLEVSGFALSASTLESLATIDLATRAPPPVPRDVLVVEHPSSPVTDAWLGTLRAGGVAVEYRVSTGAVELLLTDPQFAVVSETLRAAVHRWVERTRDAVVERPSPRMPTGSVLSSLRQETEGSHWHEHPVFLPTGAPCFGILTVPGRPGHRRRAVILLNVGAEYHVGSSRLYVTLARRWADDGYTVLRLDLAGLGDSDARAGRPDSEVYPPGAIEDIAGAVNFVAQTRGITDIALVGLCSGAYHALRAAVGGLAVTRVLMINPMTYYWKQGMTADDMHRALEVARSLGYYRERFFSDSIWRKVWNGQVSLWRIARVLVQRPLLAVEAVVRNVGRRFKLRLPRDLGGELEQICARGVKTLFIFSRGEPGLDRLMLQCRSTLKRLEGRCRVHVIDDADHIFSRRGSRAALEALLSEELAARDDWEAAAPIPAELAAP
jgi:alpha-beta hydrolase superfamily lysophospholipase